MIEYAGLPEPLGLGPVARVGHENAELGHCHRCAVEKNRSRSVVERWTLIRLACVIADLDGPARNQNKIGLARARNRTQGPVDFLQKDPCREQCRASDGCRCQEQKSFGLAGNHQDGPIS